ncbi:MAG: putative heme transporter [Acidimicrobiaceae bacterium]
MGARRWLLLAVTLVAIVLVWPALASVYGEVGTIIDVSPWWLAAIATVVVLQMVANWELYRIVMRTSRWFDIAAPQLAGNAASHLLPGGNALGAGIQVRMMSAAGFPVTQVVPALGAASVLGTVSGFVVLPVIVLAASAAGTRIDTNLVAAMWVGAVILAALLIAIVVIASRDRPWHWLAIAIARARARLRRPSDAEELERRLLEERDQIRSAVRDRALFVSLIALARPSCDYLALLFSLRAVGADVNPAAVLAAFIVSNIAGMIPLTPGGLGFVEASLAGVLTVAGASDVHADLAVAMYRVAETWFPCLAGVVALIWFQRRHHAPKLARLVP